jgi:hypothetical protein
MSAVDLMAFCSRNPNKPWLQFPFSSGDFTYATDGRIWIRVLRRPDILDTSDEWEWRGQPNWDVALAGRIPAAFRKLNLVDQIPPASPAIEIECPLCIGGGCWRCEGTGRIEEDTTSTSIDGVFYGLRLVLKMLSLPGLEAGPPPEDASKPLIFKFEGGIGALMPRTEKCARHVEIERRSCVQG